MPYSARTLHHSMCDSPGFRYNTLKFIWPSSTWIHLNVLCFGLRALGIGTCQQIATCHHILHAPASYCCDPPGFQCITLHFVWPCSKWIHRNVLCVYILLTQTCSNHRHFDALLCNVSGLQACDASVRNSALMCHIHQHMMVSPAMCTISLVASHAPMGSSG